MFYRILCLVSHTLILSTTLQGQLGIDSRNSYQLSIGIAKTLPLQSPVALEPCEEGCFDISQAAGSNYMVGLAYYGKPNEKNEIKLGISYSRYGFDEVGKFNNQSGGVSPYLYGHRLDYLSAEVGYRALFYSDLFIPYLEGNVVVDYFNKEHDFIKPINFAGLIKAGLFKPLTDVLSAHFSLFLKSGILPYSNDAFKQLNPDQSFIPIAYGFEVGLLLQN